MNKIAKARIAAIGTVMVIAFYISYFDLSDVAATVGIKGHLREYLFPIIIDGTILASTFTLLMRTGLTKVARGYANAARWTGFVATVAGNVMHSEFVSAASVIANAAVAIFLILTIETLVHTAVGTPATRKAALTPAQKAAATRARNKKIKAEQVKALESLIK